MRNCCYIISALAVSGNNLYAGGDSGIAKWNGSAWSSLASGVNNQIYALAMGGNNLYVGGSFTAVSGIPANYIAKWDGTVWSPLGSGMSGGSNPYVYALAADTSGHLFVGGAFCFAGTTPSPFIAQANIIPPGGAIQNIHLGAGSVTLDLLGLPGSVYALQRATDVRFTQNLATLLTTNTPTPDGLCRYSDMNPPGTAAFYRLLRQ